MEGNACIISIDDELFGNSNSQKKYQNKFKKKKIDK